MTHFTDAGEKSPEEREKFTAVLKEKSKKVQT